MTTTTLTAQSASPTSPGARSTGLRFDGVIRSEWIKLRSLRSTAWSYLFVVLLSLGMALLMTLTVANGVDGGDIRGTTGAAETELFVQASVFGVYLAQLVVAVLGVLVVSGEYGTGMIRSTLTAVPTRLPALAAKAGVLFVATFIVGLVSTVGAFVVATVVYSDSGLSASIVDPDVFLPLLGGALYLALLAMFALGVGTVVRSSAAGIGGVLALILIVPTVLGMIPAEWSQTLVTFLVSDAGMNMFAPASIIGPDRFTPGQSLLIVLGWVAASGIGASVLLVKRDA